MMTKRAPIERGDFKDEKEDKKMTKSLVIVMSDELKRDFRIKCVQNDVLPSYQIRNLICDWLGQPRAPEIKRGRKILRALAQERYSLEPDWRPEGWTHASDKVKPDAQPMADVPTFWGQETLPQRIAPEIHKSYVKTGCNEVIEPVLQDLAAEDVQDFPPDGEIKLSVIPINEEMEQGIMVNAPEIHPQTPIYQEKPHNPYLQDIKPSETYDATASVLDPLKDIEEVDLPL